MIGECGAIQETVAVTLVITVNELLLLVMLWD